jgi:hypothetical protein
MAVKTVNDIVGPNGLILILLVFRAYLYVNIDLPFIPITLKRAKAI